METKAETQNERIARAAHNLAALAKRQEVEVLEMLVTQAERVMASSRAAKMLLLTCAVTMLAGREFLDENVIGQLNQTRLHLQQELSEGSENDEGPEGLKYLRLVKLGA